MSTEREQRAGDEAQIHKRFDQFGKNVLRDVLARLGTARIEVEIPSAPKRMDLWYIPDPAKEPMRRELGTLGEVLPRDPCQIEAFRQAPGLRDLRLCLAKQIMWHHHLELDAKKELPYPTQIILSAGRPETAIAELRFERPDAGAPWLHTMVPGLRVYLVVVPDLPRTRETLVLRLLGTERVMRDAIRDLLKLPDDAWEKAVVLPWLARLRFEIPVESSTRSTEEEQFVMEIQEWFEEYKQSLRKEGRNEGQLDVFTELFEERLQRPLTEGEHATLAERLNLLGKARLKHVVLDFDPEQLAAWLADPTAS